MNTTDRRLKRSKSLAVVLFSFLSVALVVLFQIYTANSFEKSRVEVVDTSEKKFKALVLVSSLASFEGLGGLIHHSSHYAVTQDMGDYQAAQRRLLAIDTFSAALRLILASPEQLAMLAILDETALNYRNRLESMNQGQASGTSEAVPIQHLISLQDEHALAALDDLKAATVASLYRSKDQAAGLSRYYMKRLLIGYSFIGLLVAVLTFSALNYLRLIKKQDRDNLELSLAERRINALIDASPEPLLVVDEKGVIQRANQVSGTILGYNDNEFSGMAVEELFPADSRQKYVQLRSDFVFTEEKRRQMAPNMDLQVLRKDGSLFPASIVISRVESDNDNVFVMTISDLTQQKQWTEALLRTQRSEALAILCGGIAHQFNNQLQLIEGCADLINHNPADSQEHTEQISLAIQRAAALTSQLLSFSSQQVLNPEPVDLNSVLDTVATISRHEAPLNIEIRVEIDSTVQTVYADPDRLQSALLALTSNSIAAMPDGGELCISAKAQRHDENDNEFGLIGDFVAIEVRDSGPGIPDDMLALVTTPFFTTGDVGEATGLGLSMADGFAKQSGGALHISSEPMAGTSVIILLPISTTHGLPIPPDTPAATQHAPTLSAGPGSASSASGKAKRILVVEDEVAVLTLVKKILERGGHTVVTATDAASALSAFGDGTDIDLIFSDVMLPGGKTGIDFVKDAKQINPAVPALFASGFAPELIQDLDIIHMTGGLLQKPYRSGELLTRVEKLIAQNV